MPHTPFVRWSGAALAAGGFLTLLINTGLTPFLPRNVPFAELAGSSIFLWRQSASALAAALLLFGSIGIYLVQATRFGRFGGLAFATAFFGSALLLAWEWVDVFLLRDLALRAPSALNTLEDAKGMNLYNLGALIPLATFALGWIALAAVTLRAGILSRRAATLVIVGFFAAPLLGAAAGVWGMIVGSAILGSGLFWLGLEVRRAARS